MLYDHQKKIIDADPKKCGIFLGTGGGKTRVALMLATGRTLIIMPKTQMLDGNWQREHRKILESGITPNITAISKEQFKKESSTLGRFDTVIIDEAHTVLGATPNVRYKNRVAIPKTSQIFEAVKEYIERTKPSRVYLVTATPARNPMCIWAAGVLLGKTWGWEAFRRMFYVKLPMPGREVWQPKKDAVSRERLAALTAKLGYVGRLEDWFDVPEQTDREVHCPLTAEEQKRIRELPLEYPDPLVLIGKTHQVEQGEVKLDAIEDLLEEFGKVVVFARYLAQIERIKEHFAKKTTVYTLTGATKDRKEVIASAEKSKGCLFIAQCQVSSGYQLPSFRCMIFASIDYSMVNYTQARGRILRADHLEKNLYVHLHSGEIDIAVLNCMKEHRSFDEVLYAQKRSRLPNKVQSLGPDAVQKDRGVRA